MKPNDKPSKETMKAWHDDPANWTWGLFYYNKEDKRIFPPKRLQYLGWTINFANPYSYLTLLAIVLLFSYLVNYFIK